MPDVMVETIPKPPKCTICDRDARFMIQADGLSSQYACNDFPEHVEWVKFDMTRRSAPAAWERGAVRNNCRVYWGSHGCRHERGHDVSDVPHECDCCECPEGHHDGITAPIMVGEENVHCVAKPPYYTGLGSDSTRFYGEDAEPHQPS